MNMRRITSEHLIFFLALVLGLFLRMLHLGSAPLSDSEAAWALPALHMARGEVLQPAGASSAYLALTGTSFFLFDPTDGLARFWPALAGSLLVLLPFLLRRKLGYYPAAFLAFGLAIDPGLVTVSRQADGPMFSLAFTLLAAGLWYLRRPLAAGICAGLAILGGPALLIGVVSLGLAAAAGNALQRRSGTSVYALDSQDVPFDWRQAGLSALSTLFLVGTLLFFHPAGLSALLSGLPGYLQAEPVEVLMQARSAAVPALTLVLALLVFELFPLTFGVIGGIRGLLPPELLSLWPASEEDEAAADNPSYQTGRAALQEEKQRTYSMGRSISVFGLVWALSALVLVLLNPGRQAADLAWAVVPLWFLASRELARFVPQGSINLIALIHASLLVLLLALFWNTLSALNYVQPMEGSVGIRLAILAGVLSLAFLTTVLISLGWGWETGRLGLAWGSSIALLLYSVSMMWNTSQLQTNLPQALWAPTPGPGQVRMLVDTLKEISNWSTGNAWSLEVVDTTRSPAMRWALRDFEKARFLDRLPPGEQPAVILAPQAEQEPLLAAAYRGEDFPLWVRPGWEGGVPVEFNRWLTYHEAPVLNDMVILWARTDIFPGEQAAPVTQ